MFSVWLIFTFIGKQRAVASVHNPVNGLGAPYFGSQQLFLKTEYFYEAAMRNAALINSDFFSISMYICGVNSSLSC